MVRRMKRGCGGEEVVKRRRESERAGGGRLKMRQVRRLRDHSHFTR